MKSNGQGGGGFGKKDLGAIFTANAFGRMESATKGGLQKKKKRLKLGKRRNEGNVHDRPAHGEMTALQTRAEKKLGSKARQAGSRGKKMGVEARELKEELGSRQ